MTFLPIVDRELRVVARRSATYWTRMSAAAVALAVAAWMMSVFPAQLPASTQGRQLFQGLAWVAMVLALFAGVRTTATCLCAEKREGTLGLLFLTDLKGYDVVLGKLVASSMNAVYALLAMLPLLAIPILMGGVSFASFYRIALILANTLFFSLTTGLFVSSLSQVDRKAVGGTLLSLLGFSLLLPVLPSLAFLLDLLKLGNEAAEFFYMASPLYAFSFTLYGASPSPSTKHLVWISVAVIHGLSWVQFVFASHVVRRIWRDKVSAAVGLRWRDRWRNWLLGSFERRAAFRRGRLAINPVYWLCSREHWTRYYPWILVLWVAGFWILGFYLSGNRLAGNVMLETPGVILFFAINAFLKLYVATVAAQGISLDRDRGALELLLSTPLSTRQFVQGQRLALIQFFRGAVVTLILLEGLMLWGMIVSVSPPYRPVSAVVLMAANVLVLATDCWALSWVAMWMGIKSHKVQKAASAAMYRIAIPPWAGTLLAFTGLGLFGKWSETAFYQTIAVWVVLSLMIDARFALAAKKKLLNRRAWMTASHPPVQGDS